ncbi:MAG: hypothetical protein ACKO85_10280 [Isosphaeraceae bacterium]
MITNEDLLLNFPGQWSAFAGTNFQIDSFVSNFDANNSWLLATPFNASASNFKDGMIVQVTETSGLNPKTGIYLIQSRTTAGFILKLAGYPSAIGRGPGVSFGTSVLRVTVLDFCSTILDCYQKSFAIVPGQISISDLSLSKFVDSTVLKLVLLQLSGLSDDLKAYFGLNKISRVQVEQNLMDTLKSDYLRTLAGKLGNSVKWTKIIR